MKFLHFEAPSENWPFSKGKLLNGEGVKLKQLRKVQRVKKKKKKKKGSFCVF